AGEERIDRERHAGERRDVIEEERQVAGRRDLCKVAGELRGRGRARKTGSDRRDRIGADLLGMPREPHGLAKLHAADVDDEGETLAGGAGNRTLRPTFGDLEPFLDVEREELPRRSTNENATNARSREAPREEIDDFEAKLSLLIEGRVRRSDETCDRLRLHGSRGALSAGLDRKSTRLNSSHV